MSERSEDDPMGGEAILALAYDQLTERWVVALVPADDAGDWKDAVPVAWKKTEEEAREWASRYWRGAR